jgi:ABC-type nitrate/sulfonate/bicarbonate transport system substrate-binding protein
VPSDDAVLDTILRSGGVNPGDVRRINIGFNAVAALSAGKVDAATAFWNAEGVQLGRMGLQIREFMVDQLGAPRYPELLVVTRSDRAREAVARSLTRGLARGYEVLGSSPDQALDDLLGEVPGLDADLQRTELDALTRARAFGLGDRRATPRLDPASVREWRAWATNAGLLSEG